MVSVRGKCELSTNRLAAEFHLLEPAIDVADRPLAASRLAIRMTPESLPHADALSCRNLTAAYVAGIALELVE